MNADGTDSELADYGHDVRGEIRFSPGESTPDMFYYEHICRGGVVSEDYIPLKPLWKDGWELVADRPLTLSPSLLCRVCGHHGFIRDGRWCPA